MRKTNLPRDIIRLSAATLLCAGTAAADLTIPGADGSDGTFAPTADVTVDLSLAPTAGWDSIGSGNGVYDPDKWAVVFKYASVSIPSGVTVSFQNHPSGAPVVWLVSGDADIAGAVSLDGQGMQYSPSNAKPGPGGFGGGFGYYSGVQGASAGGGFGVGGGGTGPSGGSYLTTGYSNGSPTYGSARLLPLIGGSGGGGDSDESYGGGAGAGAFLLAVAGSLTLDGYIGANGGVGQTRRHSWDPYTCSGAGSGGGIRLIAETFTCNGLLYAVGQSHGACSGSSGYGRIRIETEHANGTCYIIPSTTAVAPDDPVQLWLPEGAPEVRVVSINGAVAPADPRPSFDPGQEDVSLPFTDESTIVLETAYVEPDASLRVRITPQYGDPFFIDAIQQSGTYEQATWTATGALPTGYFTVQAHAVNPAPQP
ncbi:MAG: hypothetical protein N838_06260 [Thiohalocapsa sp. PB-PSB1]|jgi:hypothetical protein|nr:MAG: hypothetical protein N838_06260 [Thiohalocapsa sp. PB-PSB1]